MKTYSLFLMSIMVVTADPATPLRINKVILKEILGNVHRLNRTLNDRVKKISVQAVISDRHCTPQNLCKAGKVLEKLKAEDLGLQEKDWPLPRNLVALTRNIQCKNSASDDKVQLHQLLFNIKHCTQKMYAKPLNHFPAVNGWEAGYTLDSVRESKDHGLQEKDDPLPTTTAMAVSTAPVTSDALQGVILHEIIENVNRLAGTLDMTVKKISVQQVIKPGHCTSENFCKAREVLQTFKAEDLGLQKADWLLPKKLVAYTRNIYCKNPVSGDKVELHQLLINLQRCALEIERESKEKDPGLLPRTTGVATPSATLASDNQSIQGVILEEIPQNATHVNGTLMDSTEKLQNFCTAGEVVETFKANDHGL
ncbi:uncharacterized protein LOC118812701 [Colossoma macropomum]|uniref:uncharacterized protein LOC118812701 n=1 Tax=Colossoma macropomum TaxID=42526 RepID=UPI0018646F0E|nr:uncharacterized protein LOC118812701 [Colossoma macropomum]